MDWHNFEADLLGKLQGSHRLAIIGIGADLREDDAVGNLLGREMIRELQKSCDRSPSPDFDSSDDEFVKIGRLLVLNATVAPEQYITLVKNFQPETVLIIDAAVMGNQAQPGDMAFIEPSELDASTFSTHTLSIRYFIEILQTLGLKASFHIVGIQPERIDYGEELSPAVAETKVFLKSLLLRYVKQEFLES